jgi:hypothetical protein
MAEHTITGIASVLLAIVGLAVIATLLSPKAQTGAVITASGSATQQALCVALSPVTGQACGTLTPSVSSTISFPGLGTGAAQY